MRGTIDFDSLPILIDASGKLVPERLDTLLRMLRLDNATVDISEHDCTAPERLCVLSWEARFGDNKSRDYYRRAGLYHQSRPGGPNYAVGYAAFNCDGMGDGCARSLDFPERAIFSAELADALDVFEALAHTILAEYDADDITENDVTFYITTRTQFVRVRFGA